VPRSVGRAETLARDIAELRAESAMSLREPAVGLDQRGSTWTATAARSRPASGARLIGDGVMIPLIAAERDGPGFENGLATRPAVRSRWGPHTDNSRYAVRNLASLPIGSKT
jgi:hypothetical protein